MRGKEGVDCRNMLSFFIFEEKALKVVGSMVRKYNM